MSAKRFTSHSSFGPTLESERLPVVGADRHAGRAIIWRRLLIALASVWLAVGIGIVAACLL